MNLENRENEMEELETLKQQFIVDSFVYNTTKTKQYIMQILKHCKITSEGRVIIENKNLQKIDTIALIILARYLANKLEGNISESITLKELYKMTKLSESSIRGHVSTLFDRNFIIKPNDGVYQFNPSKIEEFLDKINSE